MRARDLLKLAIASLAALGASGCCFSGLTRQAERKVVEAAPKGPPDGPKMYVVSATTLNLRAAASAEAAVVSAAGHGEAVVVTGPSIGSERVGGIAGSWTPVWWNGTNGWAFDGFLLPFHAPPANCTKLGDWASALGENGPPVVVLRKSCQSLGIDDNGDDGYCEERTRTPLIGGGWYESMSGYEWAEEVIYLPGVKRDALWAAARTCLRNTVNLSVLGLPTHAGEVALDGAEEGMATAVVDGESVGWDWSEGCSQYVRVRRVAGDAEVTVGFGC